MQLENASEVACFIAVLTTSGVIQTCSPVGLPSSMAFLCSVVTIMLKHTIIVLMA